MGASLVRRAFTLVELMMVIAIIGILVALLQPGFTLVTAAANQMRCATNLHRLWQAVSMRTADETAQASKRSLRATIWPSQVLPYLESGAQFMICPQGGESLSPDGASATDPGGFTDGAGGGTVSGGGGNEDWPSSYANLSDLAQVKVVQPGTNGATFYVDFEASLWCIKLSDEQYSQARAAGLLGDGAGADFIRSKFDTVYQPGSNRHAYWYCIEDHGGDDDFKDVMVHVTENKDGSFALLITSGQHGNTNTVVSKPDEKQLALVTSPCPGLNITLKPADDPGNAAGNSWTEGSLYARNMEDDVQTGGVVSTSYAMNVYFPTMINKAGKIMLMDYVKYLAYVHDDWRGDKMDPDATGTPLFARHGGCVNVLYGDGAVVAEDPSSIDPAVPSHETALWDP